MEDGTVIGWFLSGCSTMEKLVKYNQIHLPIGTEAWIDANGYLRQKDYIADTKGYRILKSKTVFVGQDRPIQVSGLKYAHTKNQLKSYLQNFKNVHHHSPQEAIKAAKSAPASGGTLVNSIGASRNSLNALQRRGGATYQSTSVAAVANPLGYDHYSSPNDLVRSSHFRQPLPEYLHADQQRTPIDGTRTESPPPSTVYVTPSASSQGQHRYGSDIHKPAVGLQTPFTSADAADTFHTPIAVYASTPTPIPSYEEHTTATPYRSQEPYRHLVQPGAVEHLSNHIESNTPRSPPTAYVPAGNAAIQPTTYRPKLTYEPFSSTERPDGVRPIFDRNALRRHQQQNQPPLVSSNALGNGYDRQYPPYDGVSQTANGFQYYLPRHYHEEDSSADGERRAGSFGYVDPFGIRRVVYYNASPEGGFVHRKNNRYVGFGATPYDPRPL